MSSDQHGQDDMVQVTPIGRVVEGEVASGKNGHTSANGPAYRHSDAPSLPERIEESEISYHRRVIAQAGQAQAILQSWLGHLAEKYRLPQGTRIDDYGNIVRAESPEAAMAAPPQG